MDEVLVKMVAKVGVFTAESLMNTWNSSDFRLDSELYAALEEEFPTAKFALLTNATDKLESDLAGSFILEEFYI